MSINEKKSFQLYHDLVGMVGVMSDEQAGKLLKAILSYVNAEPLELDDPVVLVAFQPVKQTLDRDHEAYRLKSEQNRKNARKRWHADASNGMQSHANGMRKDANHADTDTDTDTGKDTDKKTLPPLSPKGEQAKRKTQLSDDWQPDLEYAKQYGMNPELAFEIFSDWAKSKGHTYADWNLAWKKACREWLPDQCTKAVANQVRSGQPSQQSTGATCPKGRPYPPGCHYDKDQQLHRGPTGWEIDEERIMKMWQDLGNEENAKLWKPFDWADFQDMEAAI